MKRCRKIIPTKIQLLKTILYVPGELWIGGYGVAEGYVNEEKLTQERFVKIDGIRWYKTGDKAQYFQDGNVQFLGRLDDQVKVNGYRIELGEIENVIKRAECIDDAIAMTVETNGKKEIVAAVVEKYEKGNASHQVFMNEENPEYAEIQEIRKKVVAAFILKVYGNNVDSLTPNDNIVINSMNKSIYQVAAVLGTLYKNGRLSYLTGDIGRYLPGGDIEFIGRKDNQIKIRGYKDK